MADAPQTFAQWAAYGGVSHFARRVINTMIENRPLLGMLPIEQWPGTEDYTWILNKSLPTITWEDESATHEATQATRKRVTTYLSYAHGDVEIPIASSSTMDAAMSMAQQDAMDLIRAMGISISGKLFTGAYMTEANVTVNGTGNASTPYVDAVTAVSANMPRGLGHLKYTHAGTFLQFKAPGSTTWGAQVACAADGDFTLYDGDDTTKSVTLTLDVSDLSANETMMGALEFQKPENIAGLKELALLDSSQIPSIAANGSTITLSQLDELDEMVLGPKSEKIFLMNPRTRRAVKALIGASGGMRQGEFQGRDLSKYDLNYEGIPIVADYHIATGETQGTSSDCTRVYCLRLNRDVGYHLLAGSLTGPNAGTAIAVSDHDAAGGPVQLPVYMRRLQEAYDKQYYKWRISCSIAAALKRSTSCAVRYGVTS